MARAGRTDRALTIKVEGVREMTTAMRRMAEQTPKEVSQYHKQVAEYVARVARPKAAARPRKAHTGRTAAAIKASGTQREAAIKVTTADAKVQEFGGRAPLFGNRNRWYQVRPVNRDGYFLYPAIRDSSAQVERFYLKGLDSAITRYWSRVG